MPARSFASCNPLRWLLLLLALATSSLCAAAAAPDRQPEVPTAPSAATSAPIALTDLATRAEEEQQLVDRVQRLLAAPDPLVQLRRSLDDIDRTVEAKLRVATGIPLRDLPVMRLESLERHWEFEARRFARWEAQSRDMLAPFTASAMQLEQHRKAWSATRAAGLLDGLPPVMANRVDAILAQIDTSEAALSAVLERQFALTRRASELKVRILAGRGNVDAAIDDIDSRLFAVDVAPLWQGAGPGAGRQASADTMRHGLRIEQQFAVDYHAISTGKQQALRLIQLLLLPLIVWLFLRSAGTRAAAGKADKSLHALRRPISVWLLLSMLAVLLLEPDAPMLVHEVALVLAVVPVLRLLPAGMLRALGAWPYLAVGLYGVDRLCVAVVSDGAWYRLLLLVLSLLAICLTVWMLCLRPAPSTSPAGGRLARAVRRIALAVLAALVVAVIANVLGNVSLAEMLTSGVIDSGYMAVLLYCAVNACTGIVRALLSQPELARRGFVRRHEAAFRRASTRLLVIGATLGWLLYSADRFRLLRPLRHAGAALMELGVDVGEVSVHVGDVLVFALASWLAVGVARGVRRVLRDGLPGQQALPRGVGNSIASLSYYGVLTLGLLVALSAAGFKVSQLMLVFGALGVGIGFGLQNVVNNFVSGLVLMFERPIQPGDIVDAAGSSGTVKEIRLRSTTIRTFDGADVVVPNGVLLSGNLTNWTMHDHHRRIDIAVGVDFSADPARVLALLDAVARATPGVATQPAPLVLMTEIGESALNFSVRVWTHDISNWLALRSELLARTMASLGAAGIAVPYKQLAVHLHSVPEKTEAP